MKKKNGVRYIQGTDSRTTNTGLLAGFTSLGFVKFIDAFVGNGCVIFFPNKPLFQNIPISTLKLLVVYAWA